jgi:hypothetical protein
VTHALPALLVTLTALITGGLVHTGYSFWWLSQRLFFHGDAPSYNWAEALAVSGTATAIVLVAGLVVRRLVAANTPPAATDSAPTSTRAVPSDIALRSGR